MQPLLFDEGLPGGLAPAAALRALGLSAYAVGDADAPARGSSDETNCRWCASNDAVLVTHDRGKGDREILNILNQCEVGALFVLTDLKGKPPHFLVRALLNAEAKIDEIAGRNKRLRHYLRPRGGLAPTRR